MSRSQTNLSAMSKAKQTRAPAPAGAKTQAGAKPLDMQRKDHAVSSFLIQDAGGDEEMAQRQNMLRQMENTDQRKQRGVQNEDAEFA